MDSSLMTIVWFRNVPPLSVHPWNSSLLLLQKSTLGDAFLGRLFYDNGGFPAYGQLYFHHPDIYFRENMILSCWRFATKSAIESCPRAMRSMLAAKSERRDFRKIGFSDSLLELW